MNRSVLLGIVALALAGTAPVSAQSAVGAAPVAIKACDPSRVAGGDPHTMKVAALNITFANVAATPIRSIDFGVLADGQLITETTDLGTFSPNVEVRHSLDMNPFVFPLPTRTPTCIALQVTFQDGTTWTDPRLNDLRTGEYARAHY